MTCQELRLSFQNPLRQDQELRPELEHLMRCPECARFVEAQRDLGASLRLARQAAPPPSASLDARILADYRKHIAEQPAQVMTFSRGRSFAALRWIAVAAAIVMVAALLYSSKRHAPVVPAQIGRPIGPEQPTQAVQAAETPQPKAPRAAAAAKRPRRTRTAQAVRSASLPTGFRSLMYCDVLSCSEAMQVIRVQLPPSATPFAPASTDGGAPVFADVLVGPDGIARGIRVVQ